MNINKINFKNKNEVSELCKSLESYNIYIGYKGRYLNSEKLTHLIRLASRTVTRQRTDIKKLVKYLHENELTESELEEQVKYLSEEIENYNKNVDFLKSIEP